MSRIFSAGSDFSVKTYEHTQYPVFIYDNGQALQSLEVIQLIKINTWKNERFPLELFHFSRAFNHTGIIFFCLTAYATVDFQSVNIVSVFECVMLTVQQDVGDEIIHLLSIVLMRVCTPKAIFYLIVIGTRDKVAYCYAPFDIYIGRQVIHLACPSVPFTIMENCGYEGNVKVSLPVRRSLRIRPLHAR